MFFLLLLRCSNNGNAAQEKTGKKIHRGIFMSWKINVHKFILWLDLELNGLVRGYWAIKLPCERENERFERRIFSTGSILYGQLISLALCKIKQIFWISFWYSRNLPKKVGAWNFWLIAKQSKSKELNWICETEWSRQRLPKRKRKGKWVRVEYIPGWVGDYTCCRRYI